MQKNIGKPFGTECSFLERDTWSKVRGTISICRSIRSKKMWSADFTHFTNQKTHSPSGISARSIHII